MYKLLLVISFSLICDYLFFNPNEIVSENKCDEKVIIIGVKTMENLVFVTPKKSRYIIINDDKKFSLFRRAFKCKRITSFVIDEKNLSKINYKKKDYEDIIFDTLCYRMSNSVSLVYDDILPIASAEYQTILKKTYPNIIRKHNSLIEKEKHLYKNFTYHKVKCKKFLLVLVNVSVLKRDANKLETEPCSINYALFNPSNQDKYIKTLIPLDD